ncbi:transmembrane protein 243 isoform 2-T4 [Rhynchonycteris naso]
MEDFSTRTYGTSGLDNRPLFGETSAKVLLSLLFSPWLPKEPHFLSPLLSSGKCKLLEGSNHQFSCWQLNIFIDSSNADQCFCLPSTASKTTECLLCRLHFFE